MHHAPRDSASHLRLSALERGNGIVLLASGKGGLDRLDEGADTADAGAVDRRTIGVAADALLSLRRVRQRSTSKILVFSTKKRRETRGSHRRGAPLAKEAIRVNHCALALAGTAEEGRAPTLDDSSDFALTIAAGLTFAIIYVELLGKIAQLAIRRSKVL